MADEVKVQGSIDSCLNALQQHANTYGVSYSAHFGGDKPGVIHPESKQSTRIIPVYFNWRFGYEEYDNSP